MPKVFILVVGYNHKRYLLACLKSAFQQTLPASEIIYIDNNSEDGSLEFVKSLNFSHVLKTVANKENLGYAGGYNQGINYAIKRGAEFILCLTPDVLLEPEFLSKALTGFTDEKVGAVSAKLYKLSSRDQEKKILDSTGIILRRDRSAIDRGEGEEDQEQYDNNLDIFGVSGAVPVYRVKMILDVAYKNETNKDLEFIDNKIFAYKDDVDLGYRMQQAGWGVRYAPKAIAYHERVIGRSKNSLAQKKEQGNFAKYLSFRNGLWLLFKDESPINLILDLPFILWRQIKILGYCLFVEPKLLKAFWDGILGLPYCLKMRRRQIKRICWCEFRKRWLGIGQTRGH